MSPRTLALGSILMLALASLPLVVSAADSGQPTAEATATNVAPVLTVVTLNSGGAITPAAGSSFAVPLAITATDENGFEDIVSIKYTVKDPSDAMYISETSITLSGCTRSGNSVACTTTWSLEFHADPGTYTVNATVEDAAGANDTLEDAQTVEELLALNLGAGSVSFGSLAPGVASGIQSLGVTNYGNVPIDIQVSGTALTLASPAASIPVGSIAYSTASDMTGEAALTGSAVTLSSFDLAKGASSSKTTYWRLTMPSGSDQYIPPGAYEGTITVTALKSS